MDPDEKQKEAIYRIIKTGQGAKALELASKLSDGLEKSWLQGCVYIKTQNWRELCNCLEKYAKSPNPIPEISHRYAIGLHGINEPAAAIQILLPHIKKGGSSCHIDMIIQYGLACLELGLTAHFLELLERSNSIRTENAKLEYTTSLALLTQGLHRHGWLKYEKRFEAGCSNLPIIENIPLVKTLERCNRNKVLLISEQGLGDTIHMTRFAIELRKYFSEIHLLTSNSLQGLLESQNLFDSVNNSLDEITHTLDCSLPILSIPKALKIASDREFACNPYLTSSTTRITNAIRSRKSPHKRLIAINIQGNINAESPLGTHRERSVPLEDFLRISNLKDADLVLVQQGDIGGRLKQSWLGKHIINRLINYDPDKSDLKITAEVISCCDLLITNDTSVAHLGGALGIQTWILQKCYPSWQWKDQETTSIHYPSAKSYYQHKPFDWSIVIRSLNRDLANFCEN
jgi:hypothetical protein